MRYTYDLIVIGGGSGGLVCAAGGAGLGAKVALLEKKKLGGDCLNTGCVPSKALIRSASVLHTLRHATHYGIKASPAQFDFLDVMNRVKAIQKQIEPHDSPERFRSLGVDVRFGSYTFNNAHELTDGVDILHGKRIVIATGSSPFIPPIPGCEERKCVTSDTIWDLKTLPKRFAVIGGGPIGSELAQCFSRFGSQVSVIDVAPSILSREDEDLRAVVAESFKRDGITLQLGVQVKRIAHGTPHTMTLEKNGKAESIVCDELLVAVGRKPNTAGLNLEAAGIQHTPKGIAINAHCQTTLPHIYACGDVAGPYQFTHFADYQARLILRNAFFPGKTKMDLRVVPWCTYTDPELARVGISETEANQQHVPYEVTRYDLADLDRAVCEGEGRGLIKVITTKGKDKILGAAVVGTHAGDVLQECVFAMKHHLGLRKISQVIHPYPTLVETAKRASDTWMKGQLRPWMVRVLDFYFRRIFK